MEKILKGPIMRTFLVLTALLFTAATVFAFDEPSDEVGSLKMTLEVPALVMEQCHPLECAVILSSTDKALKGDITLSSIDGWRLDPADKIHFTLQRGESIALPFIIHIAPDSFNAIYPIHGHVRFVEEGEEETKKAHAVQLIYTRFPEVPLPTWPLPWEAVVVKHGDLSLLASPIHRTRLIMRDGPPIVLAMGFNGTEGSTRATVEPQGVHALPDALESLFVHPPWHGGIRGSVIREYLVTLPEEEESWFKTTLAIAPHREGEEPPSDGVTFRLRVLPEEAPEDALGEILFDVHTDAKTWQHQRCSLNAYTGKTIRLQLETHPGPDWDTTCDRALWGAPKIQVGEEKVLVEATQAEKHDLGKVAMKGEDYALSFSLGERGLLDGRIFFETQEKSLSFQGFSVTVFGEELQKALGVTELLSVATETTEEGYLIRHEFESPAGTYDLVAELSLVENKALSVIWCLENTPEAQPWFVPCLEAVESGAWSAKAERVYAGMGNVMCDPEAFTLAADAHQLATSFVGFDFASGISLVQALKAPPSRFVVTPQERIYSLQAGIVADFHFIPAPEVWSAVKVWRDINGLEAGPGVSQLAGRFGFDLWWGDFKASAEALQRSFRYGLTNSVVVWHNWQRHGYDYRLPDITPPNPARGTQEEFQELIKTCHDHGVLFSPHDNYIDFYPDADGFTYEYIAFHKNREPFWGWLNKGRKCQAFRWRSTQMRPFLERNVRWIREHLEPSSFFIDVWTSLMPFDSWTQEGLLEDRMGCREAWGDAFNWIRECLGKDAPMISESGHDQLIGSVDGAQANHLRVNANPASHPDLGFTWRIECEDAERIPWSDMACHDRFIYHGAGYDPRYRAGESAEMAGVFSDDYITTEMLTGHPAMTTQAFSRNTVRKYWLSNDFMSSIAAVAMADHSFVNDNIHTQHVAYENGAQVWANRQEERDWAIPGRVLPPMGFYSEGGDTACAIENRDGVMIEWSRSPEAFYLNARVEEIAYQPLVLQSSTLTLQDGKMLDLELHWESKGSLEEDLRVFVHFLDDEDNIVFQADHPLSAVKGNLDEAFTTATKRSVPAFCRRGDTFQIRAGIFKAGAQRIATLNTLLDDRSFLLGSLHLEGEGASVSALTYVPAEQKVNPFFTRINREKKHIDFDGVVTDGAFRMTRGKDGLVVMPLPESSVFTAAIDLKQLPFAVPVPRRILRENTAGSRSEQPFTVDGGVLHLEVEGDTVALYCE